MQSRDQEIDLREKRRPQLGFTHNGYAITYTKGNKEDPNKITLMKETDIKEQRKSRKKNCILNLCQRLNTGGC